VAVVKRYTDSTGVWLTGVGFRKVLNERSSLVECEAIHVVKDRKIKLLEMRVAYKDLQINGLEKGRETEKDIVKLNNKGHKLVVMRKNIELWVWRGLTGVLAYRLIYR
jgi:hypothetical protein